MNDGAQQTGEPATAVASATEVAEEEVRLVESVHADGVAVGVLDSAGTSSVHRVRVGSVVSRQFEKKLSIKEFGKLIGISRQGVQKLVYTNAIDAHVWDGLTLIPLDTPRNKEAIKAYTECITTTALARELGVSRFVLLRVSKVLHIYPTHARGAGRAVWNEVEADALRRVIKAAQEKANQTGSTSNESAAQGTP